MARQKNQRDTRTLYPIQEGTTRRENKFAVCDIETMDWTKFLCIGFFDGSRYCHFTSIREFFAHIGQGDTKTIFAHFGGGFDFLFLLDYLLGQLDWKIESIIPRGSKILSFKIKNGARDITFWDSSAILSFSLATLTTAFDVPVKKGVWDHSKTKGVTPELLEYLKSDCIGLYQVIEKFYQTPIIAHAGQGYTIAGQALKVFRTSILEKIPSISDTLDAVIRPAYVGGRVEIFKPYFKHPKKKIHCYDVNSLYPAMMRDNYYPTEFQRYSFKRERGKCGFIDCTIYVPSMYIPPLPVKNKNNSLIFPTGTFRGIWTIAEIDYAESIGCKVKKIHASYIFKPEKIFEKYVDTLYQMRLDAKSEVENITAKLLLNSLYGRTGINREKESLSWEKNILGEKHFHTFKILGKDYNMVKSPSFLKGFSHVGIASHVTAYGRIHMHRLYSKFPGKVYYTDTDSIWTTAKFKNSKLLGALKLEKSESEACFLLPKTYSTTNMERAKGFRQLKDHAGRKIRNFTPEDFRAALAGEIQLSKSYPAMGIFTFKTALKKGKILMKKGVENKRILKQYDKRVLIKSKGLTNWDTIPIEINSELTELQTHKAAK